MKGSGWNIVNYGRPWSFWMHRRFGI